MARVLWTFNVLAVFLFSWCLIGTEGGSPLTFSPFFKLNESILNCDCNLLEDGLPDWFPPPPPLPPHLRHLIAENQSLNQEPQEDCNYCHVFNIPQDSELYTQDADSSDSWFSGLIALILGSTFFGTMLLLVTAKIKRWKILPPTNCGESCPIFPENILGHQKSSPAPCSSSDPCISPVVNEKSPQSIITSCPSKNNLSTNYWRRNGDNYSHNNAVNCNKINPSVSDINNYTGVTDSASCTSSPVYAELDAAGVNHAGIPAMFIGLPQQSALNPYVVHTYSEVDAVRMAALGSSALLPDASYDNVAYLPSSHSDHYHTRSLRRQRVSQFAQLGSTTPLLPNQHQINSPVSYLTSGRVNRKVPFYGQTSRPRSRNSQELVQTRTLTNRRTDGLYTDLPAHSPSLATFRVPYALNLRESDRKRPLPPVPGVRL